MVDGLEEDFLACNPVYADGSKQKRDARVAVHKVIVAGLLDSLPKEYATNPVFQELIRARFNAFVTVLERDFETTGVGTLYPDQMSSLVLGHLVHQAYTSKRFGEKL